MTALVEPRRQLNALVPQLCRQQDPSDTYLISNMRLPSVQKEVLSFQVEPNYPRLLDSLLRLL
jgi:hypothetical protein